MSITLKSPSTTKAQRQELQQHKVALEEAIEAAAQQTSAVLELGKREESLKRKTATLQRRAAQFDVAAETELTATQKQIERVRIAMQDAELNANVGKPELARVISAAQESIGTICSKTTHESLLDLIAEATAQFYADWARARHEARNAPAVNALVADLLTQKIIGTEGIERLNDVARETLAKVEALLDGSEIFSYPGCRPPSAKAEKLAA